MPWLGAATYSAKPVPDPAIDFDACGCEFPAGFQSFPSETDQTELWDDGYLSFADESEPIFWTPTHHISPTF